jgi:hypothetical protein
MKKYSLRLKHVVGVQAFKKNLHAVIVHKRKINYKHEKILIVTKTCGWRASFKKNSTCVQNLEAYKTHVVAPDLLHK